MRVSPELLKKIKDSINIIEVVGEHVVLRKAGANYVGLCPFHSERTPSFSVSENKQLYHCYGCKKGGDLVSFVTEILGIGFPEAVEELADRAKIALPSEWKNNASKGDEGEKKRFEQREKQALAHKLNRFVAAFYHQGLERYPVASDYLIKRGVQEDLMRSFYVGCSSDSWDSLATHLVAKQAPLDLAVELGLIRNSPKKLAGGPGYFDLFRGRTLFPILNMFGKVAGFGGRSLGDDSPKYLNSPESFIFQKSKLAFGLYQAQKHIREQDEIVLVEGYFDVLAMHAAGFKNVVATCGTSLTPEHLNIFKRIASKVIVLFDGDKAGISATERAMETGLDRGWVLYGGEMPEGMDPDEILIDPRTGLPSAEGKERMSLILKGAQPLLDARMDSALRFAQSNAENRTQSLKKIGEWLGRFQDPIGREIRIQLVQKQLGIQRGLVLEAMNQGAGGKSQGAMQNPVQSSVVMRGPVPNQVLHKPSTLPSKSPFAPLASSQMTPMDRVLLAGIAFGKEYLEAYEQLKDQLPPNMTLGDLIAYPPAQLFVTDLVSKVEFSNKFRSEPNLILEGVEDAQVRSTLTESLVSSEPLFSLDDFRGAFMKGLSRIWARFSQQIKHAMADAESRKDIEIQMKLMKEYLDVQRKMKDFNSFYDEE